jgi:hypothetical protein
MAGDDTTDTSEVSHASLAASVLEADVGTWDADLEIKPTPTAPVVYHKGLATRAFVGNRWLVVDVKMYSGFVGHGVYGWDPFTQKYVGVWVDNVSSSIARATGSHDPLAGTMTYDVEVQHGARTVRYREVFTTVDDHTQIYTHTITLPSGAAHEMMRITYRRRTAT